MFCSFVHTIIFLVIFTTLNQLIYGENNDISSKTISKNHVDHLWSAETVGKRNETQKIPLNIIVRMFAFGIHRSDDNNNEQGKSADRNLPFNEPLLPSKKDSECCEDEQTQQLQKNDRLLLLPLMVCILLARIGERADMTQKSNDLRESYKIKYESNTKKLLEHKQYNFYENIKDLIDTNDNNDKIEKLMVTVLFVLCFAIFLLSIFLINRRLRNTHKKFNIVRVNSTITSGKKNHEEAIKLLPSA